MQPHPHLFPEGPRPLHPWGSLGLAQAWQLGRRARGEGKMCRGGGVLKPLLLASRNHGAPTSKQSSAPRVASSPARRSVSGTFSPGEAAEQGEGWGRDSCTCGPFLPHCPSQRPPGFHVSCPVDRPPFWGWGIKDVSPLSLSLMTALPHPSRSTVLLGGRRSPLWLPAPAGPLTNHCATGSALPPASQSSPSEPLSSPSPSHISFSTAQQSTPDSRRQCS